MSAHHLTIAKASFAAGLLRPDITKVGRDDLAEFHGRLDAAIARCSSHNVQKCKNWISENIAPSSARVTALGKYLSSLSKHIAQDAGNEHHPNAPSVSRKRLHILYTLSDLLHDTEHHKRDLASYSTLIASLQPFLVDLFHSAASEPHRRTNRRLQDLLDLWEARGHYSRDYIEELRQGSSNSCISQIGENGVIKNTPTQERSKQYLFIMPASHGDPLMPYHDLPAGNLMPHITPDSSVPIRLDQVKPLQLTAGPAEKRLVNVVEEFLKDVEVIDATSKLQDYEINASEIDELGQLSYRDEAGDVMGDTYYGWSRAFCEKMKRRRQGFDGSDDRPRGRSMSSSRSSSRSPRKRRRYSDLSYHRSSSDSRSRSQVRFGRGEPQPPQERNGNSLSTYEIHSQKLMQGGSERFTAIQSTLGTRFIPSNNDRSSPPPPTPPPPPPYHVPYGNALVFAPPPFGPNGLPIPPPRPSGWHGQWPPPPPPPSHNANFDRGMQFSQPPPHHPTPFAPGMGFQPPPPPPPGYQEHYGGPR